jgi:quinol monooxygenase YgiN
LPSVAVVLGLPLGISQEARRPSFENAKGKPMKYTMAKYTVKPETVQAVKRALAEFADEVRKHEPRTFYVVFREAGQHTFVHWMRFENEAAERRHAQARYSKRFAHKLLPTFVGKAVFSEFQLFATTKKQWPLEPNR